MIVGTYGGDTDYIYKYRVSPDDKVLVENFEGELKSLIIYKGDDKIFKYYDY